MPGLVLVVASLLAVVYSIALLFALRLRQIFHPVHVFLFSMVIPFVGASTLGYDLSVEMVTLYLITIFSFITGFGSVWAVTKRINFRFTPEVPPSQRLFRDKRIMISLLLIGIAGMIGGFIHAYTLSQMGPSGPLYNIRHMSTVHGIEPGFEKYLIIALIIGGLFAAISRNRGLSIVFGLAWASTSIMTLSRSVFIQAFLTIFTAYFLSVQDSEQYIKYIKSLAGVSLLSIGGFLTVGLLRGTSTSLFGQLRIYLIGPFLRFDSTVYGVSCPSPIIGRQTFYSLTRIFQVLGARIPIEYSDCVPTSPTYSILAIPYLDYGVSGLIFIPLLLGGFYSYLYRQVQDRDPYATGIYAVMIFPLIFSFFSYQFTITTNLYLVGLLGAFWIIEKAISSSLHSPSSN